MLVTVLTFLLGWLVISFVVACAVGKCIHAGASDQAMMEEQAATQRMHARAIAHRV